jgi:soluble lytic murein transglycosylase-like protein
MNQISLPFQLRPSLLALATCLMLNHAGAAELSRAPPSTLLAQAVLHQDESPTKAFCPTDAEPRATLLARLSSALSIAYHSQAEPGFVLVEDVDTPEPNSLAADTLLAKADLSPSVVSPQQAVSAQTKNKVDKPDKLSYLTALPHEFAQTARALSAHIAKKFKVEPSQANSVVASAMRMANQTGLSPTLLLAVIAVESEFNPMARNRGALGLMQIIPFWHKEKVKAVGGPDELMKVDKNIATGSVILKEYIDRNGSVFQGLVRYNASTKAKEYSTKVLRQKKWFETIISER